MTPAQQLFLIACCQRAVELWAEGDVAGAHHWFDAACRARGRMAFVDHDVEAGR